MYEDFIVPPDASSSAPARQPSAPARAGGNVESFVETYLPTAQRVSEKTGVAPEALLGQWGLETGWGKSVIPGTNNLGNIKDPSRKGPVAVDNMTKSSDSYMSFASPDEFGDHYAGLLQRRYGSAMNASDPQSFFAELKRGGYAEDPLYVQKGVNATGMVSKVLGAQPSAATKTGEPSEYYVPQRGQYASYIVPPERTTWEAVKDTALGAASGVAQGVGMLAGVAGADNAVTQGANEAAKSLMDMQSDQRKAERQARAETIREAEQSGSAWEEVKANVGAFLEAPAETMLNALGTSAPTILMSFIPGLGQANAARLILQGAAGAAQGAGAVKSSIYEDVKNKVAADLVKSGMDKAQALEEAEKVAVGAQAYDGQNGGNIAAGALLGIVAGRTGIEGGLSRAGLAKTAPGRMAVGAIAESLPEAAQGGQERIAVNQALQNEGFDVPTFQGVAGQAAAEGIASAGPGALFGAIRPELQPVADKAAEPNSPLSKAAIAGAQSQPAAPEAPKVDAVTRLAELEAIGRGTEDQVITGPEGYQITIPGEPGRFFTDEEKAEYDQLKALRDATPGMTPDDEQAAKDAEKEKEPDLILERARGIEQMLRTNEGLSALRSENSPVSVQTFLSDLAKAKSPSTPASAREQSLSRLETTAEWLGFDLAALPTAETVKNAPADVAPTEATNERPMSPEAKAWMDSRGAGQPTVPTQSTVKAQEVSQMLRESQLSDEDRTATAEALTTYRNPNLPERTRQQALNMALEIVGRTRTPEGTPSGEQTPAVLADIPPQPDTPEFFVREAERRENGAWEFRQLGFDDEADALVAEADSLREKAASARAGELGMEDSAEADADIASPPQQQTLEQATAGLPRVQIPAETSADTGEAGTALRRKRKGQLLQLAANGFDTVERRDNGFVLVNTKSQQEVLLDSPADAQMARVAIKEHIDAKANTAAASPMNDRLEPTPAQIQAGNYKKSDVIDLNGVKIKIENPAGSVRRGTSPDGQQWETKMVHHYGEIMGAEGADGDKIDVFIGNRPDSNRVFVVDQVNPDGTFDEHKLVFGATGEEDARQTYLANYEKGWTGLGAITELPLAGLKQWLKTNNKLPAAETATPPIKAKSDDGSRVELAPVSIDSLPSEAVTSSPRGSAVLPVMTKRQAVLIQGIASVFGKDVVFFADPSKKANTDGFVNSGDPGTIYINVQGSLSPISVLGHELMHILRIDNPQAYEAIAKVVRSRVSDPKGFKTYYNGKNSKKKVDDTPLEDRQLEELIADLNGTLMSDQKFWREVFDEIAAANPDQAKGIIAQLAAFVQKIVDAAIKTFSGQPTYRSAKYVKEMDAVREAFRKGLAQYAQSQGITKQAMQAEILRASKDKGIKRSPTRPGDGLTVEGYHFSKQPRQILSTGFYGSGLRGSDREEILSYPDQRLRERLSFYVDKGTGISPESGVGGIAHKATLTNIYDADADPRRLRQGRNKRGFEMAVLNAGYSGYLNRMEGAQPGQVILLGQQTVTPEVLGLRTKIEGADKVPDPVQREMDLGDKIMADRGLPTGQLTPSAWLKVLMEKMPAEAAEIMAAGDLGDKPLYRDELATKVRSMGGDIKRSTQRDRDEYADVEAKYKGTDQWMVAPNGAPTKLTERQWVQVRTPSFKKWFGDWEAAHKAGGVWSAKPGTVSVAVGDDGEPLVLYHGSTKGGFMEFQEPAGNKRGDLGIFTTNDYQHAASYVRKNRSRRVVDPEVGEQTGWNYISNKTGEALFTMQLGESAETIAQREKTYDAKAAPIYGELPVSGDQPGVYALFVNIRNPNESHFEGANWDGSRMGQYQVRDEDGETIYDDDGRAYFDDRDDAMALAMQNAGAVVEPAEEHYESTDSVVKEAWRYKNDGAIIRQVVDDGGGGGNYSGEPVDVFVVLSANQVKSADFNGGTFDVELNDIRRSTSRDPSVGDKTDVDKLPNGRVIDQSAAVGSLESSLALARSKSYRRGRDLKVDLQARVLAAARAARVKLTDRTKNAFRFFSSMVVEDAKYALKSNQNAVGWYDQKVSRAIGALSTIHPEIETDPKARLAFLWALATTSNGLKVDKNFELAEAAYRHWKKTGRMPKKIGIGNAAGAINKGMEAYNELSVKVGEERLAKFMATKFEVGQVKRMLGMSVGGEWQSTPVRGAAILGPKIGNGFYSNLNGYFDALTMDRWLMRTWGRMTGTLLETSKEAIDKSRAKLSAAIDGLSDEERKTLSRLIGQPIRKKMTRSQTDAVAKASQKASMKKDKRDVMMSTDAMNDFRKAANLHHMTMDGQKEAPSGPAERNWIRAVFAEALSQLNGEGINMTMSDLQALLWYPERRLYDAAKSDEDVADGYDDDEAPDYANAAYNLATSAGVDPKKVTAAMDAAEAKGTVKGAQLTEVEKQKMLEEFKAPPAQSQQLLYEVAPDPDNQELTSQWNELSPKDRAQVTDIVKSAVVDDVFKAMGLTYAKTVRAVGGYESLVNPNLITDYKSKDMTYEQAKAMAAALGFVLDQKSVVLADPRVQTTNGMVRVKLGKKAEALAPVLMKRIGEATGATDFTSRGNNIDILNFTGQSTESLANQVYDVISDYDETLVFDVSFGDVRSELIGKEQYGREISGVRPQAGREILPGLEGIRDRARSLVAEQLRGRRPAGEVPGSAGSARRSDAESDAAILRSPGRDRGGREEVGRAARGSLEAPERAVSQEALSPLPGAPSVNGATGPDPRLVRVAQEYAAKNGIPFRRQVEFVKVDPARAKRIAAAYAAMEHAPQDPVVQEAYQNLIQQTVAQYKALEDAGYKFWFIDTSRPDNADYAGSPWNAMRDIRANKSMGVFPTADGFGSNEDFNPAQNPLLAETGYMWPVGDLDGELAPVLANDLFRAVHDAFGHGIEGAGFRADGEENAWQAHVRLFTGSAIGAITSETRGQNSWLNYGPYGEKNRTAKIEDTKFADQKTGLMPAWTWSEGLVADEPAKDQVMARPVIPEPDDNLVISFGDEDAAPQAEVLADEVQADQAKGRRVTYDVEVEDTGETAKMTVDGGEALADYDQRIETMTKLLECLRK